jgi:hypothetical protein
VDHVAVTLDGRHLRLGDDRSAPVRVGGTVIDPDAVFERLELGHGRVALRTADGRFLAVRPDPGLSYAVYAEGELSPAAAFEEILWPTGHVSLRSCHLTYVGAHTTGRVRANRTDAGPLERFLLVAVPMPVVPAQRQPVHHPVATTAAR